MDTLFNQNSTCSTIKNIGFISTRFSGSDGVSLEVTKWAEVLRRLRYNCYYFAGELDRPPEVSFPVPEAHFSHPEILEIQNDLFGKWTRRRSTTNTVSALKERIKSRLYEFCDHFSIDLIIPENCLAIPMNIPLGLAVTEFIAETGTPAIAHHHDFSWERKRFSINACSDYLNMAFPPIHPSIYHVVINSIASEELSRRRGTSNIVIPNVLDFASEPPDISESCPGIRKMIGIDPGDPFILQPTRVVPRKWIERSIEIVQGLETVNPVLVITHPSGDEGDVYYRRITEYANRMGVRIRHIDDLIAFNRNKKEDADKPFSIADVYSCCDLITYPSGYEGFGNAFLEAIYFRKPIIVNRYSTYITDIEPKGFDVIVIDGFATSRTIDQIHEVLGDENRRRDMVERNFQLAAKEFSYEVLTERLTHILGLSSDSIARR